MKVSRIANRLLPIVLLFSNQTSALGQAGWFGKRYDAVCLKHPEYDTVRGRTIFTEQLQIIVDALGKKKGLKLKRMLNYEASICSEESSLGNYWTVDLVADSDIGSNPRIRQFKFGIPVSFDRLECPFFQGHVDYLCTKWFRKVKVVDFTWHAFRSTEELDSLFFNKDSIMQTRERMLFQKKFQQLLTIISRQLGNPVVRKKDKWFSIAKWKSPSGICAVLYLYASPPDVYYFNEITLRLY